MKGKGKRYKGGPTIGELIPASNSKPSELEPFEFRGAIERTEADMPEVARKYDKSKSFFDSITSEVKSQKLDREEVKKHDMETFGETRAFLGRKGGGRKGGNYKGYRPQS